jgi:hypothetical protein
MHNHGPHKRLRLDTLRVVAAVVDFVCPSVLQVDEAVVAEVRIHFLDACVPMEAIASNARIVVGGVLGRQEMVHGAPVHHHRRAAARRLLQ